MVECLIDLIFVSLLPVAVRCVREQSASSCFFRGEGGVVLPATLLQQAFNAVS